MSGQPTRCLGRSCPLLHFVNLNVFADVRFAPILLQKSKIERDLKIPRKLIFDVSTAAKPRSADTMVRGRFCVKRCGPSRHRLRDASAVLENFVRHPKRLFNTIRQKQSSPYKFV